MNKENNKNSERKERLKEGFTTGAAAAASVKGALYLLSGDEREIVRIHFLSKGHRDIEVKRSSIENDIATCTVIKDAGDDPDITHKAEIGAKVKIVDSEGLKAHEVIISGGIGVGKITKKGLEVEPGNPAINSGPVKMINNSVNEVLGDDFKRVEIEVFVPRGEILAKNTLNDRLGIVGGISILGTTGIVRPMSHDAYIATIGASINVARANSIDELVLTTGRRSERFSQELLSDLKEESFVQIGDFFQKSLDLASQSKIKKVTLAVFFGKAVKMALGFPHTHAGKSELTMEKLSGWCFEKTDDKELTKKVLESNTAREAFTYIYPNYNEVITYVGEKIVRSAEKFAGEGIEIKSVIFDFDGKVAFRS
ncbi:MAG: cobalamin biosynthesis protein CbiD [Deltaproteobacteria bacterium]|nr:cobalamin biosynthesis protein CbiD [Deltaproteobacteria bacterium]